VNIGTVANIIILDDYRRIIRG